MFKLIPCIGLTGSFILNYINSDVVTESKYA